MSVCVISFTAKPILEELPKWGTLRDILQEIQKDILSTSVEPSQENLQPSILVVCKELYMCRQLTHAVSGRLRIHRQI